MMKQISMTCLVDMPEDLFEQSAMALKVKPAWEAFLTALKESKVPHSVKLDVIVLDGPRKRTGKLAATPKVVLPVAGGLPSDDEPVRMYAKDEP